MSASFIPLRVAAAASNTGGGGVGQRQWGRGGTATHSRQLRSGTPGMGRVLLMPSTAACVGSREWLSGQRRKSPEQTTDHLEDGRGDAYAKSHVTPRSGRSERKVSTPDPVKISTSCVPTGEARSLQVAATTTPAHLRVCRHALLDEAARFLAERCGLRACRAARAGIPRLGRSSSGRGGGGDLASVCVLA
jgi:hypothetical protein